MTLVESHLQTHAYMGDIPARGNLISRALSRATLQAIDSELLPTQL